MLFCLMFCQFLLVRRSRVQFSSGQSSSEVLWSRDILFFHSHLCRGKKGDTSAKNNTTQNIFSLISFPPPPRPPHLRFPLPWHPGRVGGNIINCNNQLAAYVGLTSKVHNLSVLCCCCWSDQFNRPAFWIFNICYLLVLRKECLLGCWWNQD